ncbi:Nephrocystin-3 [Paramuricea clavata]|uniref:Nephrocystin-3 n=1 Tax=Paramuricea clavata TaxID=317549 RepID=A0A7D9EH56_PARCT|nr:Nephrocystin-3 [Paramuricea clavata]
MLLSDGSGAKLGCYEGISLISKGNVKLGMECIEKHLDGLQNCADQQLVKCLCLQLLALFYTDLDVCSKSRKLTREAIEVCKEIGNYNLFLIGDCEETLSMTQKEYKGEQLILFVYLLTTWSKLIFNAETQLYFLNFVHQLEQQLENKAYNAPQYLFPVFTYGDSLLAILGVGVGQEVLLDEKIAFLKKSVISEDCCFLTDRPRTFPVRDDNEIKQGPSVDTCRNALDLSLKQNGKQHWNTGFCYLKFGLAENNAENYKSALNAFDQALEIMTTTNDGSSGSNVNLADVYIGKGKLYTWIEDFESAIASFEEALGIKRKLYNEGTKEIAQILFLLGNSQMYLKDLSSSLATLDQALQIRKKLYAEKPSSNGYLNVVECYFIIGRVHYDLGNITESVKCFKTALEVSTDCDQKRSLAHSLISVGVLNLKVDENVYVELLKSCLPVIKENYRLLLPVLYLGLGLKQVESGKYKAGLAFFQEALDIEIEVTLRNNLAFRQTTVSGYIAMGATLFNIEKFKLAGKAIDRAIQIAESLPKLDKRYFLIFRCNYWKGRIQIELRKYITAIDSLKRALLQLPKILNQSSNTFGVFKCHGAIATAYFFVEFYEDSLTSLYDSLSVIRYLFPDGSEDEAEGYVVVAKVAQKMKNKTLEVNNLRLAYKTYSKILGKTHFQTERSYVAYVRALIGLA